MIWRPAPVRLSDWRKDQARREGKDWKEVTPGLLAIPWSQSFGYSSGLRNDYMTFAVFESGFVPLRLQRWRKTGAVSFPKCTRHLSIRRTKNPRFLLWSDAILFYASLVESRRCLTTLSVFYLVLLFLSLGFVYSLPTRIVTASVIVSSCVLLSASWRMCNERFYWLLHVLAHAPLYVLVVVFWWRL